MRRVAAPLAAVLLALAAAGCGGGGAEPGAPKGATLVLDFQPNAVHSGLYAAQAEGFFKDEGVDLMIREPSSTADSAKLLESGRTDFALMDINDFGIARQRGLDLVAIAAIVQRPLASVIARDRNEVRTPADLVGKTVGVTGVPSDDAVLDTVLRSGGIDPSSVHRVTIGFDAVSDLAAKKIDAATAFWNAEGVQLKQLGVPTREFRVDQFGAPRYPELLLVTRAASAAKFPVGGGEFDCRVSRALERGYDLLGQDPDSALGDLLAENPSLDQRAQEQQFDALRSVHAFSTNDRGGAPTSELVSGGGASAWLPWAVQHHLLPFSPGLAREVIAGFQNDLASSCRIAKNQSSQ
jgi:NitT/TauT family transport system substrate-binding protein/putative hydroxymethylpyrimidine transport system substrate-binding protein